VKTAIWLLEAPEGIERHRKISVHEDLEEAVNKAWDLGPGYYTDPDLPEIGIGECFYADTKDFK
jgi:hypothetical protein